MVKSYLSRCRDRRQRLRGGQSGSGRARRPIFFFFENSAGNPCSRRPAAAPKPHSLVGNKNRKGILKIFFCFHFNINNILLLKVFKKYFFIFNFTI
jgi:hypothetical protein